MKWMIYSWREKGEGVCILGEGSHFVLLIVRNTVESVFQPCRILNGQILVAQYDVTGLLCLKCTQTYKQFKFFKKYINTSHFMGWRLKVRLKIEQMERGWGPS